MKRMSYQTTLFSILVAIILSIPVYLSAQIQKTIAVIGTGYVGLVSGAGLAQFGNEVICADIDSDKIDQLLRGEIPIYEPGLQEIVARNVESGRLSFTDEVAKAIQTANVIFIAVGTPMGEDGNANLSYIESVVKTIAQNFNKPKIIVTKSTVPIGTGKKIRNLLENHGIDPAMFFMVSNPEFLREGSAVDDFLHPDRLVIGAESDEALTIMCEIYEPLIANGIPHVLTDITTAEIIKYASNAFLATKLSFINEIANLCDAADADTQTVSYAMGLDKRISPRFLKPGPGFGGSCFPKDALALIYMARQHNVEMHTVQAALKANKIQYRKPVEKLLQLMKAKIQQEGIENCTIAILGLAFKANTDDIRYSPAISAIKMLLEHGAHIKTYDPAAMENMRQIFPNITYCNSLYEAVTDADAIIIMTEWDEFKQMDLARVSNLVRERVIVDARNIINPSILKQIGFVCDTIGQSYLCKNKNHYLRRLIPIHVRTCVPFTRHNKSHE